MDRKTRWIFYTSKDTQFDHYWALKGSCLSGYVTKTGKSLTKLEEQPEIIKNLILEFHTTENTELKSYISRELINYSLPNLIKLLSELIHI